MLISVIIPVYRDGQRALVAAAAMLDQSLPDGATIEIILVDDGSTDDTQKQLVTLHDTRVNVLCLPQNVGRSSARNAGAASAQGEILVFIDCDCQPTSNDFLVSHQHMIERGCVASCGRVTGEGNGFWSKYQSDASIRREHQHMRGVACSGSSQNFSVTKSAFSTVGGFNTRYKEYGFEDRDLFERLSLCGKVGWCSNAEVRHLDSLTLMGVATKLQIAATSSARIFAQDHPERYKTLGYASLDTRLHHWLWLPSRLLAPVARTAAFLFDRLHAGDWLPYPLARFTVKIVSALSYGYGTTLKQVDISHGTEK